jgi:hypothetical protein
MQFNLYAFSHYVFSKVHPWHWLSLWLYNTNIHIQDQKAGLWGDYIAEKNVKPWTLKANALCVSGVCIQVNDSLSIRYFKYTRFFFKSRLHKWVTKKFLLRLIDCLHCNLINSIRFECLLNTKALVAKD